ncbi:MAG: PepSY domain-containing protein [Candidatus Hydrogenedentes bacterium]|nr:PepSY domain-containing protein [Candidatus Hydrogenedentota bacterium]
MKKTRLLHKIHRWTGLLSGANVLLLSLTGAYLVFSEEIHEYFHPPRGAVLAQADQSGPAPIQAAMDAVQARHPGAKPALVTVPEDEENVLGLFVQEGKDEFHAYELDTITGEVYAHPESVGDKVNEFVLHLHADLFLGALGIIYLGIVALLFFVSTITGALIYGPFMKQAIFGALRWDRGMRRGAADLHKVVGAASLAFNALLSSTGFLLTIGFLFVRMWAFNEVTSLAQVGTAALHSPVAGLPVLDEVFASAKLGHPDIPVRSVSYPGELQGPWHYMVFHTQPHSLTSFIPAITLVPVADPQERQVLPIPLWVAAVLISVPFHFGNFGGLGVKVVYCIFGLSAGLLSVSGAYLTLSGWAKRARMRRKAVVIDPANAIGTVAVKEGAGR